MTTIRAARESDVPDLIALARRSWLSGFGPFAPDSFVQDWLARGFEQLWYPRYWPDMSVAEVAGVILGVVQPMKDEINGLWVDPVAQAQGVGTALLLRGENQIVAAGYKRVWLSCSGFNRQAQLFYRKRGYREIARETKDRAGGITEEMFTYEKLL